MTVYLTRDHHFQDTFYLGCRCSSENYLITSRIKGQSASKIKLLVYGLDESLCVCRTIDQYLERTEVRRNYYGQLLLGLIKPHKLVISFSFQMGR